MLTIDGSMGEGGGQILRTALSLSLITGTPFRMKRIRAGRGRPGLLRQHLTAIGAAEAVCGAQVEGNQPSSQDLVFRPGAARGGDHTFSVGTAGSATLVFQTVFPALLMASQPSHLVLEGGTHNPAAPPFEFLKQTFLPTMERMGARCDLRLIRHGFYPAGGGRMEATISPSRLQPIELVGRGAVLSTGATAMVAHIPMHVASREIDTLHQQLGWDRGCCETRCIRDSAGPGNVVIARVQTEALTEVFCGFGQKGISAEAVAAGVATEVRRYLSSPAVAGEYLADQLMLPCAMAGQGAFSTVALSKHASTQMEVIGMFLSIDWKVAPQGSDHVVVTVRGRV